MNEEFNQSPKSPKLPNSPEAEAPAPAKRGFSSLTEALESGCEDGAAKAKTAVPELKSGITNVVHDVAYGLAYGTVFAGAFVNELIPGKIREGFSKGAEAGRKAGEAACGKAVDSLTPDPVQSPPPIIS